ncbi:MAG: hypothetical protein CL842_00455 [Crocinitomicaceae bacterium]|nr:hypothetical protein [Crocinitomicaceae bacterium]
MASKDSLYQDSITQILSRDISDSAKTYIYYSATARVKNSNPQLALSYAYNALELAANSTDSLLLGLLNNRIGLIYLNLGKYELAEEFLLKNLLIQGYRRDNRREADAFNNLGILFMKKADYETAKNHYLNSCKLYKRAGFEKNLGTVFNSLGIINKHENQIDSSVYYFNLSLELNRKTGNIRGLANNFINLLSLYQKNNDTLLAKEYLEKALKIEISTNNVLGELTTLIKLTEITSGNYSSSNVDSVLKSVVLRAKKTGFKPIESLAYQKLYELSKEIGDSLSALKYLENHEALKDSLSAAEAKLKIKLLNKELERAQHNNRYLEIMKINNLNIALLEKDKQRFILLSIGLFALSILGGILLFLFVKERKTSKLVNKQAEELQIQKKFISKNNADLLITISDLREAEREEEALLGLIAHDLKAPIGQIQSLIELLTGEIEPKTLNKEDVRVYLKTMNLSFARIDELISTIIQTHKSSSDLNVKTHLNSMLTNIIERSIFQARTKKIDFSTSLGKDFVLKNKDPEKLKRIIENLISNAIKFSRPSSEIRVKAELISDGVVIEIGDSGPGFSKNGRLQLSEVIEDNNALPTGSEKSDKIGLKVVKAFSEDLGIRVIINSEKKAGTTFQLYLTNLK